MAKSRDLFKKIRDAQGTFHAKIGLKKDRNGMDLTDPRILRSGGKRSSEWETFQCSPLKPELEGTCDSCGLST